MEDAPEDRPPFHSLPGVEDWRILGTGLHARYRCVSLLDGVRFAAAVVEGLGDEDRRPDIDLRDGSVTLRLPERPGVVFVPSDLALLRAVQRTAASHGLEPDPASLRSVQIAVAHAPGVDVRDFWQAVLGYEPFGDEDAADPFDRGPRVWFHEIEHGRPGRGRSHVDVYVPADQGERTVEAALAAGGRIADDSHAPEWWTLASPDDHGVDIAPWPDRL